MTRGLLGFEQCGGGVLDCVCHGQCGSRVIIPLSVLFCICMHSEDVLGLGGQKSVGRQTGKVLLVKRGAKGCVCGACDE
jgi:hypothetical protein